MSQLRHINRPPPSLRNRTPHHLPEIALILRAQCHNTHLRRPDNHLTRLQDPLARLLLQPIDNKQQQEAALQQLNAKEIRHEAHVGVVAQDLLDGLGGAERVGGRGREGRRGGPEVFVLEEGDGVPFADEEDVEDVDDVRGVGDDGLGVRGVVVG